MGRIIGLIGCTCLVIVALRLTNLQHTDHTLKGGEERLPVGGRVSPREHYKLGREMYLRGRYRDAVQHLDAATATTAGLTGTERRQADDYLGRARSRLQAAANGSTVRGQSDAAWEEAPSEAAPSGLPAHLVDATRNRVDKLLGQAQAALKRGDRVEALKLANLANNVAKGAELTFAKNELTPAAFLARLQNPNAAAVTNAAVPDWATDDVSVRNAVPASRGTIQQTGAEAEEPLDEFPINRPASGTPATTAQRPATPSRSLSVEEQAAALIAQARQDFKAGRYEEARRKAFAADELDVTFSLFEDRPELLLADIDRVTNTTTFANATNKSKSASQAVATQGQAGTQPSAAKDSKKQQAARLLDLARQDITNGNLEAAQSKAEQAAQLNVAYGLFEDMPELVLNDVAARRASEGIANGNSPAVSPASATSPAAKPQALALLAKARQALTEDRVDEARQLAIEAERLKAPYNLFDDRPDLVLADVARTTKRGPTTVGTPVSAVRTSPNVDQRAPLNTIPADVAPIANINTGFKYFNTEGDANVITANEKPVNVKTIPDDAPQITSVNTTNTGGATNKITNANTANVNTATARQNLSPAQIQAVELLRQARQLIKAGRHEEARAKADEAERMNVTFPVFADRPDLVFADLDAKLGNTNVASRPATKTILAASGFDAAPVDPNANPFAPDTTPEATTPRPAGRNFGSVTQADSISEINPAGASAGDLYNRGMSELNRGNRQAAYAQFLAAHQSGQKLDYVKTQRLQDYLRELAPRTNRSGIQLLKGQVSDTDIAMLPEGEQPAPLDTAQQEQMIRFDRIRSEVLNSVFKAERMRATDPEAALTLVDQAMSKVEGADLSEESAASLMKQLNKTRSGLQNEIVRQQPNLEIKKRNEEVKNQLEKTVLNDVRIEQEFVKLVEEFNDLYKQRRFAEAEVVAKKAMEMNPKDPTAVTLFWKSRIGRRNALNEELKIDKEGMFVDVLTDVENGLRKSVGDDNPMKFADTWPEIKKRRNGRYRPDNRKRGEAELKIEQSLSKRISLHEDKVPLGEVINKIRAIADINIVLDTQGLEEEAASTNSLVSIEVDGISVKSALNLILTPNNLAFMVDNEVLKITSRMRQQGELSVSTYSVADLVIPIPDPASQMADPFGGMNQSGSGFGGGQMSIPANGQGFGQVGQNQAGQSDPSSPGPRKRGHSMDPDFTALTELITSTIAPDTWDQVGGPASVRIHPTTLSLVIRQTQKIHEEITDLLEQLRRLQDLQVTIEVRFVSVSDRFFERIGIDFNFNIQPTTGLPTVDNRGLPLQTFGSVNLPQFGLGGGQQQQQGQQQQGQQQQGQQQQGAAAAGFFGAGPTVARYNNPSNPSVVGMSNPTTFSRDLTVPFHQGSFAVGVPTFGNYNPQAGMEMGLAILSDIEAFFFIQAAQGDQRNNLLFAPKVTVFNGQTGFVTDSKQRPFVTGLTPTVGFGAVGFQPQITTVNEGITLSVTAVVSSDRRYVRLSVNPNFTSITDVFTFSFIGGSGGQGGQQGQGGQNQQGGQGGFGGGQFGGQGGQGGGQQGFGIGGGIGGQQGGQGGQGGGQQGQQGQGGGGGQTITVQQPVTEVVTVITTVSVPDGGTVLLGGVKRLKEGRNMSGVPILNKIPYVSRLFKNTGVGRETESLMLMITPRILIQEEEEELLGIPST